MNVGTFARYALVAVAIVVAGYAVYRFGVRLARGAARERAALDAVIAVAIGGPVLLFLVLSASTLTECGIGKAC